ncbi:ribosomal protein YmL11 precursor, mitochondrial [Beauveria bassiana ARSEF 2860]|uniref:Ribosomal protein YmL11, mitochondrial n=1 Tax=Beauveria bassiana (strain ARSEF 2860) TaxID=655819 RepID=J4UEW1_BEAB2|nr:ribosomal protein YmL11 precursor, mitochondrial [Beauveria bassiana ARSEF 2860]EJP60857.1 ribosomal protein YmL11 precursor, mitochondrial [Beauveria bassiana ARSEF 2860]
MVQRISGSFERILLGLVNRPIATRIPLINREPFRRRYAAASLTHSGAANAPVQFSPATKPPSARPAETRKSQLIRNYTSLLRTTPLVLFFQHSNLTAVEWAAVRRELKKAVSAVSSTIAGTDGQPIDISNSVQLQVLRTNMFDVALKIVEFYNPEAAAALGPTARTWKGPITHDLSEAAYQAIHNAEVTPESAYSQIEPLMVGPLAALVMPAVSPIHLAAALSILSPAPSRFPAPTRKKSPGYHDPVCQNGLAKLTLVGGRIEGKVFDQAGVNWIGGISGGLDGLRAQLVHVLQSAGLGITATLEGGSKNLWLALEGRKEQLKAG